MQSDLGALIELLRRTAAAEILPRFRRTEAAAKSDGSLVTEADLAVQRHIREALARDYPGLPLLGEEMTEAEQESVLGGETGAFWVLDPLDGTGNFASGFPGFAISLALIEGGESVLGLVLDPERDQCFHAVKGGGARLDGAPIAPYAPGPALKDCLAMVDLKRLPPRRVPRLLRPGGFRSQRNLGAVALEWCWLAAGRFQLYLHGGQRLWDYAAGRLIAAEAGVPSMLYRPYGTERAEGLDLGPRLAVAAADPDLLALWLEYIELPLVGPQAGAEPDPQRLDSPSTTPSLGSRSAARRGRRTTHTDTEVLETMNDTDAGLDMELASGIAAFESRQFAQAAGLLGPLAEAGDPQAQYRVAIMAQNGLGMVANPLLAFKHMRAAAEAGIGLAEHGLGFMYLEGECVDKSPERAVEWFKKAAEQGLAGSQTTLAMLYEEGRGVPKDQEEANRWYRLAGFEGR